MILTINRSGVVIPLFIYLIDFRHLPQTITLCCAWSGNVVFSVVCFSGGWEGGCQIRSCRKYVMFFVDWEQSKRRLTILKNFFSKMTALLKRNWSRRRVEWAELDRTLEVRRKPFGDNWKIASPITSHHSCTPDPQPVLWVQYLHHFHSFSFYTQSIFSKFKVLR